MNINLALFLFDINLFSIVRTDIHIYEIKNILKLNWKMEKIRKFKELLKLKFFGRVLNLGSKNVVYARKNSRKSVT